MNSEEIRKICNLYNYDSNMSHLFNRIIIEHDIKQANINALKVRNLLSDEEYYQLSNLPKQYREETIGWKIRNNPNLQNIIHEVINESKYRFMINNSIDPNNIIRIANDSITHIANYNKEYNTIVPYDNNNNIIFVNKGIYSSFIRLRKVLVFIGTNNDTSWNIDIKGINDSKLYLHEYFITFLCNIIQAMEIGGQEVAINQFNSFYNSYVNRELDIRYYREFNSDSSFRIVGKTTYLLTDHNTVPVNRVNIDYNLSILRILYSYLMIG